MIDMIWGHYAEVVDREDIMSEFKMTDRYLVKVHAMGHVWVRLSVKEKDSD